MQPRCVQIVLSATSLFSLGWRLTIQNPSLPAGVFLNVSSTVPGMLNSSSRPTRQLLLGLLQHLGPEEVLEHRAERRGRTNADHAPADDQREVEVAPRHLAPLPAAAPRMRSPIDGGGAYAPPTASIAIRWSGGASFGQVHRPDHLLAPG